MSQKVLGASSAGKGKLVSPPGPFTVETSSDHHQSAVRLIPGLGLARDSSTLTNSEQDETWPACLNCQKNGKSCPGPPARHTFRDLGPRFNPSSARFAADQASAPAGKLRPSNTKPDVHMNDRTPRKPLDTAQRKIRRKWLSCPQVQDIERWFDTSKKVPALSVCEFESAQVSFSETAVAIARSTARLRLDCSYSNGKCWTPNVRLWIVYSRSPSKDWI